MAERVVRVIEAFGKLSEELVEEISLSEVPLETLQEIFDVPKEDPMYDCWVIDESKYSLLRPYVGKPLDLNKFDYFLTCCAVDHE